MPNVMAPRNIGGARSGSTVIPFFVLRRSLVDAHCSGVVQ